MRSIGKERADGAIPASCVANRQQAWLFRRQGATYDAAQTAILDVASAFARLSQCTAKYLKASWCGAKDHCYACGCSKLAAQVCNELLVLIMTTMYAPCWPTLPSQQRERRNSIAFGNLYLTHLSKPRPRHLASNIYCDIELATSVNIFRYYPSATGIGPQTTSPPGERRSSRTSSFFLPL